MVISDETSSPILIDNVSTPLGIDYFWALDLENRDFMLSKIKSLEEHINSILVIKILGYAIEVPSDWNILIYSPDTLQLDVAEIHEISKGSFHAFIYDHKNHNYLGSPINVIDYKQNGICVIPTLAKTQMLCHHLGPNYWICISPVDNYSKYLRNAIVGDIL